MKHTCRRMLSMVLVLLTLLSMLPATVLAEGSAAPARPTATVTEIANPNLTFAMNFKVDEVTDEQLAYYKDWYADFELTVNKEVTFNANGGADGFLSGQYDAWSPSWVNVPFEDVTLAADQTLKIMEYAAKLMGQPGLKYTYGEVYEFVKDFDCGVFFTDEFLADNPDLKVTLELKMYNPEDESENYVIGDTYVFELKHQIPTATVTEIENEDLTFAMNFKVDEVTNVQLAYYKDWYADFELTVNKEVTFNANGGADGFLSGQYDAWSPSWVNVPFEDVTLAADQTLKIMEYAAKLMGQPGLKYTYGEVYEFVKDFDCGVFFTDEFLAANPDVEVKLELRMYDPTDETKSHLIGDTYIFRLAALPTATVTETDVEDLTFSMNFKVDEATDTQLAVYGDWYADFELTVNKEVTFNANGGADGYLSGQYDAWNENWVNVPFEDVTLWANQSLKIMDYAAKLMGQPGLKLTFNDVHNFVKDFDCGVFFEPEFLAANPDLVVTLELKMYNPDNTSENYVIGDTYIFRNTFVAYNVQTKAYYTEASTANDEAQDGETVKLIRNTEDTFTYVPENVTFDLNGYTYTVGYFSSFGDTIDSSENNEALLKVARNRLMMQTDNTQLPVRDGEGYRFIEIPNFNTAYLATSLKFAFQPLPEASAHELLLKGQEYTGVTVNVRVGWGEGTQDFVYSDDKVTEVLNSYNSSTGKYDKMYTLVLNNTEGFDNLAYTAVMISDTGVEIAAAPIAVPVTASDAA